jgi:hypothetical protein
VSVYSADVATSDRDFTQLQARLGAVLAANKPGSDVEHVLVGLPSYSVGESLLSHYAERVHALEHRYLVAALMLSRIPACRFVFICSVHPGQEVVDYYVSLIPPGRRQLVAEHLRIVEVPDRSARSVAAKLLDRPDIIDDLRAYIGGEPVVLEPWNVTECEVDVALRLGAPVNGARPELRALAYKSAGRSVFAAAGVPLPCGVEGVRSPAEVLEAIGTIRRQRPDSTGVVVKLDDSGAGDGNVVIRFGPLDVRSQVELLADWYVSDLRAGGVVEELVTGDQLTSPSVQLDVLPDGRSVVLATHEQVLGGEDGQVYVGCRFPADPAYAAALASYGQAVGEHLAGRGVTGRLSVDFMASRVAPGAWSLQALEINLRKGGTTHPYAALRNLVPGRYDAARGQWVSDADGTSRSYCCTDNLVDASWRGLPPEVVIRAVSDAGIQFDYRSGTGVALHMLSCLAVDGRCGLTAIGRSPEHAEELYAATRAAIAGAASLLG